MTLLDPARMIFTLAQAMCSSSLFRGRTAQAAIWTRLLTPSSFVRLTAVSLHEPSVSHQSGRLQRQRKQEDLDGVLKVVAACFSILGCLADVKVGEEKGWINQRHRGDELVSEPSAGARPSQTTWKFGLLPFDCLDLLQHDGRISETECPLYAVYVLMLTFTILHILSIKNNLLCMMHDKNGLIKKSIRMTETTQWKKWNKTHVGMFYHFCAVVN